MKLRELRTHLNQYKAERDMIGNVLSTHQDEAIRARAKIAYGHVSEIVDNMGELIEYIEEWYDTINH